jgi:spermine oxidase
MAVRSKSRSDNDVRIAIVGGGMAGLAALRSLLGAKCRSNLDVLLLESSDRLGGRCRSEKIENHVVELGATFIHGTEGNVIHDLAVKYNLLQPSRTRTRGYERICNLSNGKDVSATYAQCRSLFFAIEEDLDCDPSAWSGKYKDLYEYYYSRFFSIASQRGLLSGEDRDVLEAILQSMLQDQGFIEGAPECRNVALCTSVDYETLSGHPALKFPPPSCYSQLVDHLVAEIPEECIHLNTEVWSIQWSDLGSVDGPFKTPPIQIVTNRGTFEVDHVITTFPLGVLKAAVEKPGLFSDQPLFVPTLPECKVKAIKGIGMDVVNKLFVEFPESAVDDKIYSMNFFWLKRDIEGDVRIEKEFPWIVGLFGLHRLNDSNIFIAWFAGKAAVDVGESSQEQLSSGIVYAMEKFYQRPFPAKPLRILTSHWEDKHIQSGYSFSTSEDSANCRLALSEPLGGGSSQQVLFAGEATHSKWYSTAHGAYDSGVREAKRLMKLYL